MSEQIEYLINLHKEGKISDPIVDKALNSLKEPEETNSTTPEPKIQDGASTVISS